MNLVFHISEDDSEMKTLISTISMTSIDRK